MIKTFRGQIKSSAEDSIVLHTNTGHMGYRITKFEVMPATPGAASYEYVVKIYKISQTTIDGAVDFSDQELLGTAFLQGNATSDTVDHINIVFDQEIFNQDIYITNYDVDGDTEAVNYYIELEQMKLDLNENTVATLKDIRNNTQ